MIEAKVIEHSISSYDKELVTLQLKYPRFIHAEFMTHRVFSRNASSSRAIPVAKMIEQVRNDPAMPIHWGANQAGMQAQAELEQPHRVQVQSLWQKAAREAADTAELMTKEGTHKQVANRILEPFQWMHVVVTATEWDNFFLLRDHDDAQPEIARLAQKMRLAMLRSTPRRLSTGDWHLPYVTGAERAECETLADKFTAQKLSAARCARVSYLLHDGAEPDMAKDLALFERLAGGVPIHASPLEHQGTPGGTDTGNFVGWTQFRKVWEKHAKTAMQEGHP
jgi:thymidylate synthase ThyX